MSKYAEMSHEELVKDLIYYACDCASPNSLNDFAAATTTLSEVAEEVLKRMKENKSNERQGVNMLHFDKIEGVHFDKIKDINVEHISRIITSNDNVFSWFEGDVRHSVSFEEVKQNFFKALSTAPLEVPELLKALQEGTVEDMKLSWNQPGPINDRRYLGLGLAKMWLWLSDRDSTPDNNTLTQLTVEWIETWILNH
jgi:hypothetical protein